jgi:hypothetical protein
MYAKEQELYNVKAMITIISILSVSRNQYEMKKDAIVVMERVG